MDSFEDEPALEWSWRYVSLCVLIPLFNGLLNSYCFAGLALHYSDMGWPIERVGLASTAGYIGRTIFQKMQVSFGYWIIIPAGTIHLATAVVGVAYGQHEWAVILEIAMLLALQGEITNEGLAFDALGITEVTAKQASCTLIAVLTIFSGLSESIGGAIYQASGWQGMSVFHTVCQACSLILFSLEPGVWSSFFQVFRAHRPHEETQETEADEEAPEERWTGAVPARKQHDLDETLPGVPQCELEGEGRGSVSLNPQGARKTQGHGADGERASLARLSGRLRQSGHSARSSRATQGSRHTKATLVSGRGSAATRGTGHSFLTVRTIQSAFSIASSLTNLKDNENFKYHPVAISCLEPQVAQPRQTAWSTPQGQSEEPEQVTASSLPADMILPAALISLCCFNNAVSYYMEVSVYTILFKEYHKFDVATVTYAAQSAGDFLAAFVMQLFAASRTDPADAGFFRRLTMQPYGLCWVSLAWALADMGITSPWLIVAIASQVLMGSLFVYTAKFSTEMNLFYSLGDSAMFLTLQVWCKTAHSLGACVGCFLGPLLYAQLSPVAPFLVGAALSAVILMVYTLYFSHRIGLADIETAEDRRSMKLGIKRVSKWQSAKQPAPLKTIEEA